MYGDGISQAVAPRMLSRSASTGTPRPEPVMGEPHSCSRTNPPRAEGNLSGAGSWQSHLASRELAASCSAQ